MTLAIGSSSRRWRRWPCHCCGQINWTNENENEPHQRNYNISEESSSCHYFLSFVHVHWNTTLSVLQLPLYWVDLWDALRCIMPCVLSSYCTVMSVMSSAEIWKDIKTVCIDLSFPKNRYLDLCFHLVFLASSSKSSVKKRSLEKIVSATLSWRNRETSVEKWNSLKMHDKSRRSKRGGKIDCQYHIWW